MSVVPAAVAQLSEEKAAGGGGDGDSFLQETVAAAANEVVNGGEIMLERELSSVDIVFIVYLSLVFILGEVIIKLYRKKLPNRSANNGDIAQKVQLPLSEKVIL